MPPKDNEQNNLSKYFTWEFIKIVILVASVLGGFFQMRAEIQTVYVKISTMEETIKEMKNRMNQKFDSYDEQFKDFYKNK